MKEPSATVASQTESPEKETSRPCSQGTTSCTSLQVQPQLRSFTAPSLRFIAVEIVPVLVVNTVQHSVRHWSVT